MSRLIEIRNAYWGGTMTFETAKTELFKYAPHPDAKEVNDKLLALWKKVHDAKITIDVPTDISREVLLNVFITALEGGSNYWYFLGDEACELVRKAIPAKDEKCLSVAIFRAVFDEGIEIPVNDVEDQGEVLGTLSRKTMHERLLSLANDKTYGHFLHEEIAEEGDAESSDVIFQFLVMGEVVYG